MILSIIRAQQCLSKGEKSSFYMRTYTKYVGLMKIVKKNYIKYFNAVTSAAKGTKKTKKDLFIRMVESAPFSPVRSDRPKFLPTQFIRSSGIVCTKYSRCSFGIVHIGRFFCCISSSRFFKSCSKRGNQINSHEHNSGLSANGSEAK